MAKMHATKAALRSLGQATAFVAFLAAAFFATTTLATVGVSDNGTATYTVPIAVPPGIAGMEPKLALIYSSGGINGPVGHGWSIQGLSLVTRCPATVATDGIVGTVSFEPTDKLCLDGQRLIATSTTGVPSPAGTLDSQGLSTSFREYRTEKDSFARVRAYGAAGGNVANGPLYFKVWTKSGQILELGNTSDSRIEAQGKSVVMVWAVNRMSDTVGNFIDFKYEEREVSWGSSPSGVATPGKEWNISRILYTGRSGVTPRARVDFYYADRTFGRSETYHDGAKNVSVRLLSEIRTFVNQQETDPLPNDPAQSAPIFPAASSNSIPVKTYKLDYEASASPATQRNRLARFRECSGRDSLKCLPAHEFTYSDGGGVRLVEAPDFNLVSLPMHDRDGKIGALTGDFDGDGRTDIVRWHDNSANNELWWSRPSGTQESPAWTFAAAQNFTLIGVQLFDRHGCVYSQAADFNGDGLTDLLRIVTPRPEGHTGPVECANLSYSATIFFSNGDGSFRSTGVADTDVVFLQYRTKIVESNLEPEFCPARLNGRNYHFGDFNGDGRLDVLTALMPGLRPGQLPVGQTCDSAYDPCPVDGCNKIYLGNGNGGFTYTPAALPAEPLYMDPEPWFNVSRYLMLDVNDDGVTDIVPVGRSGRSYLSKGGLNFVPAAFALACGDINMPPLLLDANGDRRLDYVCGNVLQIGLGGASGHFQRSASGLEQAGSFYFSYYNSQQARVVTIGTEAADFNGDGRTDILRWADNAQSNGIWLAQADGTFVQAVDAGIAGIPLRQSNDVYNTNDGNWQFHLGNFTGRGHAEILRVGHDATANRLFIKQDATPPDLLIKAKSPSGVVTDLRYRQLTAAYNSVYANDRGTPNQAVFPVVDVQPSALVVQSVETDSGVGSLRTQQSYFYRGMKADTTGRGFLGMREIQREFQGPNAQQPAAQWLTVTNRYLQSFPLTGVSSEVVHRLGRLNPAGPGDLGGQVLSRTTYTYCDRALRIGDCPETSTSVSVPMIRRPYVRQTVETGKDLNNPSIDLPTSTTTNTYLRDFGDVDQIRVETAGLVGGQLQTFVKVTDNSYYPENTGGDNWILGRLQRATVTSTVPNVLLSASKGSAPNADATDGQIATNQPPVVSVNIQSNTGTAPATVVLGASAIDPNGVQHVDFYANGVLIPGSRDVTAPYAFTWAGVAAGTYSVTAVAVDSLGASATSSPVSVTVNAPVNQPPSVSLSVTSNTGVAPATVVLTASAADPEGGIKRVEFYRDGTLLASDDTAPYAYTWSNVPAGNYTITARAYDLADLSATSAPVVVPVWVPAPSISAGSVSGNAPNAGSITGNSTASVTNGQAPFRYTWAPAGVNGVTLSSTSTPQGGETTATQSTATFSANLGWGNPGTNANFTVTVTDAHNRTSSANVNVNFTSPAAGPSASLSTPVVSRTGTASALPMTVTTPVNSVTVIVTNGQAPFTYVWRKLGESGMTTPGGNTSAPVFSAIFNAWSQTVGEQYEVTVTDALSRSVVAGPLTVQLSSPPPPPSISAASVSGNAPNAGLISGSSTAGVLNGLAPFRYTWTPSSANGVTLAGTSTPQGGTTTSTQSTASFSANLGWNNPGTNANFTVTVIDAADRSTSTSITVNFTSPPQLACGLATTLLTASRSGAGYLQTANTAAATASGGTGGYSYTWDRLPGNNQVVSVVAGQGTPSAAFGATVASEGVTVVDVFRLTVRDSANNPCIAGDVRVELTTTIAPSQPNVAVSPTSHAFGTVADGVTTTATFTVVNSGGAGTINASLVPSNGGAYGFGARTCPANGSTLGAGASCTIAVTFTGVAQCGGQPVQRPATLTVTVGSSSAQASLTATNQVYSVTALPCR